MHDDLAPYEPDELDELLSAELDDELGAAARDLGLTVDEVIARIDATPGADDRRRALVAARGLLGEPPDLDELLAQRLRAKAVRAAVETHSARELDRRRRRRQLLLGATGIAAAAVAVVALAGGLNGNGGTKTAGEKGSEAAPTSDTAGGGNGTAPALTAALGAFADKRSLATAALARTAAAAPTPGVTKRQFANRALEGNAAASSTSVSPPAATNGSADFGVQSGSAAKPAPPAVAAGLGSANACPTPEGIGTDQTLVLRATATLAGKPVVVFVFAGHGEHAIKVEDAQCALVDVEMQR